METLTRQLVVIVVMGWLFFCAMPPVAAEHPLEPFTLIFNAEPRAGDMNLDGLVDWLDLLEFGNYWLLPEGAGHDATWERADTYRDGSVDGMDFALLANNWRMPREIQPDAGWEWIDTGFNYILMDFEFPEGQSRIGYAVGESQTYKGEGIVIKTTDGGDTWTRLTPEGIPGLEAMSFVDVNTGYAAGWDDYVIKTADGGITWDTVVVPSGMTVIADIEFRDPNHGILLEGMNVYITEDGGQMWTTGTGITQVCHEVTFANEHTLFAVGNAGYVFKSTDAGYTWISVHRGVREDLLLGVDFLDETFGIAVGDYSSIVSTFDGGKTWSRVWLAGDMLLKSVCVLDADTAYLCGTPEYVFKTTDGGAAWVSDYDGNWERAFNRVRFADDGTGFICGGGGILLRKAWRGPSPQ